jgi:hypothetical protein
MYREIFKWIILLISQPAKAWEMLSQKEEKEEGILLHFVYPLIGFLTVAAFLGVMFTHKEFDVELALKASIRELLSAFGGFFLTVYLLNETGCRFFKIKKDMPLWQCFTGYSSSLMFVLNAVLILIPELFFLRIFILYTYYIVWEGGDAYMGVGEKDRLKFAVLTTTILLAIPYAIRILLFILMPGMRF